MQLIKIHPAIIAFMDDPNLVIDPLKDYSNATTIQIIETCGIVPMWVKEWEDNGIDMPLKEFMSESYGFGSLYEFSGAKISDSGIYSTDNDPDLKPLISFATRSGIYYQYEYAICAIPDGEGGHFCTRMD